VNLLPICSKCQIGDSPSAPKRYPSQDDLREWWLRGLDLNQRPSGYEPDELPGCSTPRYLFGFVRPADRRPSLSLVKPETKKPPRGLLRQRPLETVNGFPHPPAAMPGDDLLFQRLSVSTIGAVRFHGRVRDGIGWVTDAIATKQ
jgi:hypothetical protein